MSTTGNYKYKLQNIILYYINEILKYQVFLFLQKECSRNNRAK